MAKKNDKQNFQILLTPYLHLHHFLIAPLDWGLGHATRCMPIIEYLLLNNKKVSLASGGAAEALLKKSYPHLPFLSLPTYGVKYKHRTISFNVARASPKILWAIWNENRLINRYCTQNRVNIIFSDNRYGARHSSIPSIILCHQIRLEHPNRLVSQFLSYLHQKYLNQFYKCWIVDQPPPDNLAGKLSLSSHLKNHEYTGWMTRLKPSSSAISRDFLVILSGPEPSRSLLEQKLLKILNPLDYMIISGSNKSSHPNHLSLSTHDVLEDEIGRSRFIICRSGYTSLMDLILLRKSAILIPTPGQYEQEYLASRAVKLFPQLFKMVKEDYQLESKLINLTNELLQA